MVMGVLNVTPDSFSDGGLNLDISSSLTTAHKMVDDGVYIIDIGGESTRPGAETVPQEKELGRTIPIIQSIRQKFPNILISIDTYMSSWVRNSNNKD